MVPSETTRKLSRPMVRALSALATGTSLKAHCQKFSGLRRAAYYAGLTKTMGSLQDRGFVLLGNEGYEITDAGRAELQKTKEPPNA